MTGDQTIDSILLIVALLLGAIGNALGWPVLVKIAEWIKARDEAAKRAAVKNGTTNSTTPDVTENPHPLPPKEPL